MVKAGRRPLKLVALVAVWGLYACHGETPPRSADARPVPVTAVPVQVQDVPVYLHGLGSVAAFYTVTVRAQVEGRIDRVAFTEGQDVKRGDLLVQIDPRPYQIALHQAEAALGRDAAQLRNGKLNLDRNRTLRAKDLISAQQLDDQQTQVDQLESTVLADQTQVDNARLQLDYAHVTAPIDGRTGVRLVDPGNVVRASDANGLVVVTQLDPIAVLFTLPEDDLPRVSQQMAAGPLKARAFSRDGKTDLGEGVVQLIDNQINASSGTMRLKAVFANHDRGLWPNQFVKVRLHLRTLGQVVVTPVAAVQRGPRGAFVYVVAQDATASARPVTLHGIEGDVAVVTGGLTAGETVVIDGQAQLRPGSKVVVHGPDTDGPALGEGDQAAP